MSRALALSIAAAAPVCAQGVAVRTLSFQGLPVATDQKIEVRVLSFVGLPVVVDRDVTVPTLSFHGTAPALPTDVTVRPLSFVGLPVVVDRDVTVPTLSFYGMESTAPRLTLVPLQQKTAATSPDGHMGMALRSARVGSTDNLRQLDAFVEVRAAEGAYASVRNGATLTISVDEGPGRGWRRALPVSVPSIASGASARVPIPFTLRGTGVVAPGTWPTSPGANVAAYYRHALLRATLSPGDSNATVGAAEVGPFCYDAATMTLSPAQGCDAPPGQ